ncbi:hypothetical protein CQA09_29405, partial [Klebsiella pneumoniae]
VSLLFPAKKVTPQIPDGVCNMGALRFAMKLVLSKAETALYLPDRLGVSLLFPAKKVTPQIPDGVCNMGALRFAMKLVLS